MGTIDTELIRRWIKQKIMFDQATITYRELAKESSCSVDQARELLKKFCESEDGKRLKVQSTFLIFGDHKVRIGDCTRAFRIETAKDSEIEQMMSKFHSVSCVQIYSISATQAPDSNVLKSCLNEPVSLKPMNSIESYRKDSQKERESKPEPKIDQPETTMDDKGSVETKKIKKSEVNHKKIIDSDLRPEAHKNENESKSTTSKSNKDKTRIGNGAEGSPKNISRTESTPIENKSKVPEPPSKPMKNKDVQDPEEKKKEMASTSIESTKGESSSRKRVRKTRVLKKKKIIRVKDKKGYRVNRETIEEVEESYSDWESSDNEGTDKQTKKIKKTTNNKKDEKSQLTLKEPEPHPSKDVKEEIEKPVTDLPKNRPLNNLHPAKKKNSAPNSKDQSNITSFFKKS